MKLTNNILSHSVEKRTNDLLNNVLHDFPNREILIHPLLLLQKETVLTHDIGDLAKYVNTSNYVAIYVKQNLNDKLFNIALSHEILPHYQITNGIKVISDVNYYCKKKINNIKNIITYVRARIKLEFKS